MKVGKLRKISDLPVKVLVESDDKRYIPSKDDDVIGVVISKFGMTYRIELGGPRYAHLDFLAFEGATKRNRPQLAIGALVYCRVQLADRDLYPIVTCKSEKYKKEWMSGEAFYTELKGGYTFKVPLSWAARLREKDSFVLNLLAKHTMYEIAVGVNGRVWINAPSETKTVLITNSIINARTLEEPAIRIMIEKLFGAYGDYD